MKKLLSLTVCLLFVLSQIMAQLSVPSFFSDHMVLQREKPINIWGTASAGERISVTLGNAQRVPEPIKMENGQSACPLCKPVDRIL